MNDKYILTGVEATNVRMQWNPDVPQRILVVDDEPLIRQLYAEALVESGYDVDCAEHGMAAWKALQKTHYDLLITDNEMPNGSGIDLLKMLYASRKTLPVIMATASLPNNKFFRNPKVQPYITLLKPHTLAEFLLTVEEMLIANRFPRMAVILPSSRQVRATADCPPLS